MKDDNSDDKTLDIQEGETSQNADKAIHPDGPEGLGDEVEQPLGYKPVDRFDASAVHHLSRMYKSWFLDYASYVILERAVPDIEDGLKPVQRRILHSCLLYTSDAADE